MSENTKSEKLLMTQKEAADYLGVSPALLIRLKREKKGPRYILLGTSKPRYPVDELKAWVNQKLEEQG